MRKLLVLLLAITWMAGCSSTPTKPAEQVPPKPQEPDLMTGRAAFQQLYIAARGWARDAQPYRLESTPNQDSKGRDGKSAIWRAGFASQVRRGSKPYVWSGTNAQDAPSRGVNPGTEDTYNPSNASTTVFDIGFLKTDSDKAFETAQQHGGDKILQKSPDIPVLYILEWNRVENMLIWHVIYGNSRDDAKLKIAINATSGEFIRVEKS
jgi:hypothetical protein